MVTNLDVNVFLYLNDFIKGFLVCIHIQFWQKKQNKTSDKFINSLDFYSALIKLLSSPTSTSWFTRRQKLDLLKEGRTIYFNTLCH